jgi:branched-subunit amino acid aminotransferase/4-amino-4-deoxychorismate lyase
VVRGLALQAAARLGYARHEGKVRLKRLLAADEAFLTSSLCAIRPLVRFDGRPVGSGRPGPVTRRIAEAVAAMRHASRSGAKVEERV